MHVAVVVAHEATCETLLRTAWWEMNARFDVLAMDRRRCREPAALCRGVVEICRMKKGHECRSVSVQDRVAKAVWDFQVGVASRTWRHSAHQKTHIVEDPTTLVRGEAWCRSMRCLTIPRKCSRPVSSAARPEELQTICAWPWQSSSINGSGPYNGLLRLTKQKDKASASTRHRSRKQRLIDYARRGR